MGSFHAKFSAHWDHEPRTRRGNEADLVGDDGFRLVTSAATQPFMESSSGVCTKCLDFIEVRVRTAAFYLRVSSLLLPLELELAAGAERGAELTEGADCRDSIGDDPWRDGGAETEPGDGEAERLGGVGAYCGVDLKEDPFACELDGPAAFAGD